MNIIPSVIDTKCLLSIWHLMDERNRSLGFDRYDFGDIQSHHLFTKIANQRLRGIVRKLLQIPELLAPIRWRKILSVRRRVVPSLFFHVGMAYLDREQLTQADVFSSASADHICEEVLRLRFPAEHVCWQHPYDHHATAWRDVAQKSNIPPSCAHHTSRIGFMLLKTGKYHKKNVYLEAGLSAVQALMTYHRWHRFNDDSCAMSYYPFTDDEVINVAADAAALLASVPADRLSKPMYYSLNGLVKMIIQEQNADGSWYYCTRRHHMRYGGKRFIDNHHSALAQVIISGALGEELSRMAKEALDKGLAFYMDAFYTKEGKGYYYPKHNRLTGVVGYSEGTVALCTCLQHPSLISQHISVQAAHLLPNILKQAIGLFLNSKTGDVACFKFFGLPYAIRSIRWGSGPLMQAISHYLRLLEEIM